jgi:hypothetical protein
VVQRQLAAVDPVEDICDVLARTDRYGPGPGCYPKPKAPKPVAHPFCRCRLRSRPDLDAKLARERPGVHRAFLRSMDERRAARVMGSKRRLANLPISQRAADLAEFVESAQSPTLSNTASRDGDAILQ